MAPLRFSRKIWLYLVQIKFSWHHAVAMWFVMGRALHRSFSHSAHELRWLPATVLMQATLPLYVDAVSMWLGCSTQQAWVTRGCLPTLWRTG